MACVCFGFGGRKNRWNWWEILELGSKILGRGFLVWFCTPTKGLFVSA
jgi:hypothetical protein